MAYIGPTVYRLVPVAVRTFPTYFLQTNHYSTHHRIIGI